MREPRRRYWNRQQILAAIDEEKERSKALFVEALGKDDQARLKYKEAYQARNEGRIENANGFMMQADDLQKEAKKLRQQSASITDCKLKRLGEQLATMDTPPLFGDGKDIPR
jgi:hypothetical protein